VPDISVTLLLVDCYRVNVGDTWRSINVVFTAVIFHKVPIVPCFLVVIKLLLLPVLVFGGSFIPCHFFGSDVNNLYIMRSVQRTYKMHKCFKCAEYLGVLWQALVMQLWGKRMGLFL
jgi:hypothetical protein